MDEEIQAVIDEACAELERVGLDPMSAAYSLVAGGLHVLANECDNVELAETIEAVVEQMEAATDHAHVH